MSNQYKDQGGAATYAPSRFRRWMTSKIMSKYGSLRMQQKKHQQAESNRKKNNAQHTVEYFHQVEDGYSFLAAQTLLKLKDQYNIDIRCHLVSGPKDRNLPEPDLLIKLSGYDSYNISSYYGLDFPSDYHQPNDDLIERAKSILAAQNNSGFLNIASKVSHALWLGHFSELEAIASEHGSCDPKKADAVINAGSARQAQLKHYSGAMFFYGNEWYWGVDRLYHLENRLTDLGLNKNKDGGILYDRPQVETTLVDDGSLTFEIFPSLRSPYTALIFDPAVQMARDKGVNLRVRPVLPMVMRGLPVTFEKGLYIFSDSAREARAANIEFGNMYDPVGDPVRRGYSLYPWACKQGKGIELISSFLKAAFVKGINLNTSIGLKKMVENAGLDWKEAKSIVGNSEWEEELEHNRLSLVKSGLWGVPSFRLFDENDKQILAAWGQDRLWLFSKTIDKIIKNRNN